jgi:vacuolar protein sorting-associated protein 13A/C
VKQRVRENVRIHKSQLSSAVVKNVRNDLLGQSLSLLTGMDVLGNASSTLGHLSKGVAALSMDNKFINNRQTQVVHPSPYFCFFI